MNHRNLSSRLVATKKWQPRLVSGTLCSDMDTPHQRLDIRALIRRHFNPGCPTFTTLLLGPSRLTVKNLMVTARTERGRARDSTFLVTVVHVLPDTMNARFTL